MLLYICLECGAWTTVDVFLVLSLALSKLGKVLEAQNIEQPLQECPGGHGTMQQVLPEDRLSLRPRPLLKTESEEAGKIGAFQPKPGIQLFLTPRATTDLKELTPQQTREPEEESELDSRA